MLDTYYLLGAGIAILALLAQLAILVLQSAAYRRHGHKCFLVLCVSCILGLVYSVLMGVPYILPMDATSLVPLTAVGALIGAIGVLLSIWGTVLLLKSYRTLAEAASQSSLGGA
jgi:hypothetical protein